MTSGWRNAQSHGGFVRHSEEAGILGAAAIYLEGAGGQGSY